MHGICGCASCKPKEKARQAFAFAYATCATAERISTKGLVTEGPTCIVCGRTFIADLLYNGQKNFCSYDCAQTWYEMREEGRHGQTDS